MATVGQIKGTPGPSAWQLVASSYPYWTISSLILGHIQVAAGPSAGQRNNVGQLVASWKALGYIRLVDPAGDLLGCYIFDN